MTAVLVILIVVSGLSLAVWGTRHLLVSAERSRDSLLRAERASGKADLPFVSVVVAAKDEAENIETCVRTMLGQDYGDFEMIVVNDRSEDATGRIVRSIAAEDGRLRLIDIEHLPDGWCGKNNAMQHGIAAARGDWICMIDADCRQTSTRSLAAAMAYALETDADLLSVLPNLEMKGFWENVVQPVCGGIMMIWFNPVKVNDPSRPHAYANGAFMLMRRSAYERIGTHEAVKDQVNEDMHLAALVKGAGLKLRVIRNAGLYLVRMYSSLGEIVRGWGRIFYGTFGTLRRLTISFAVLAVLGLVPWAGALVGLLAVAAGAPAASLAGACAAVGAAAALMQLTVIFRFYRLIGARASLAWTYALGCAVGMVALLTAMGKLRKGSAVTWRNTTYTRGAGPT